MKRGKVVIPRVSGPQEWLKGFCDKAKELKLFSDTEVQHVVDIWETFPFDLPGGGIETDNLPLFQSTANAYVELVKSNYAYHKTREFFGPDSVFADLSKSVYAKPLIRRLWMLVDFVSDEFTQLPRVIMMWRRDFPEFDFSDKTAYAWSLFDVRTFVALICQGKIDISRYSDKDKEILYKLIENPGLRQDEVTGNSIFYKDEVVGDTTYRRITFDIPELSNYFKQNILFYERIFKAVALFTSWDAIVVSLAIKMMDISEENSEMFECFDYFIDNFSRAVLETFRWKIPESPKLKLSSPFMAGLLGCLIPQSKLGIFEWKRGTMLSVNQAVSNSASLWEFQGTMLKHYRFREIDIFNDKERFKFTMSRVSNRLNRELDRYNRLEEGPDTFIAFLLYHMEGANIIEQTPNEDGSIPTFLDGINDVRDNGMNLSNVSISIIWKLDAILDVLKVDDSMKSYELENAEVEVEEDDPKYAALIKRDRDRSRQLFGIFNSYSLEATESLFIMKGEYERLKAEFDFKTRSKINLERLEYDKSAFAKVNAARGETRRTFADFKKQDEFEQVEKELKDLEKEMVQNSPWLWEQRELAKRRIEYDVQWKFIRKLCNSDQIPWLFVNDMTGLVTDPSSGNTYGRPFSAQEKSEIERRQNGIPSMYWYAQPPVRQMDQFDERRFHGGDGFMIPPHPVRPTLDSEFVTWAEDRIAYDNLRQKFGPYQIARMFVLREPPNAQQLIAGRQERLPQLGNAEQPEDMEDDDDEEDAEEDADNKTQADQAEVTRTYDEFDPPPGSTVSQLQLYIEAWWEKNARLVNIQGDKKGKKALPKYVKIKRSAGSAKTIEFRLKIVIDLLKEHALTDEERSQLDIERRQRIDRLQELETMKAKLQPFLDDLQKGRVSDMDESILQTYQAFQKQMEQKWNDVSLAVRPLYAQEVLLGRYDPAYLRNKEEYLTYLECIDFDENNYEYDWDREAEESQTDPYKKAQRVRAQYANYALWEAYIRHVNHSPLFISYDDYKKSRSSLKDFSTHFGNHSGRVGRAKVETQGN
jgi:hypothetical protein